MSYGLFCQMNKLESVRAGYNNMKLSALLSGDKAETGQVLRKRREVFAKIYRDVVEPAVKNFNSKK